MAYYYLNKHIVKPFDFCSKEVILSMWMMHEKSNSVLV